MQFENKSGWALSSVLVLVFLSGCGGSEQSSVWRYESTGAASIQRDLIDTESEEAVVQQYHYDVTTERVYVEARMYPKDKDLAPEDMASAPARFFGFGPLGMSIEDVTTKDEVGAIPFEPALSISLSSRHLRGTGEQTLLQPFGELALVVSIDETPYEVERRSGLPFFGESTTEQVGDGRARLELRNAAGETIFLVEDEYVENSSEFTAMFSPDGRYVLLELPDHPDTAAAQLPGAHRLVLVGELPITKEKLDVVAELSLSGEEREAHRAMQRRKKDFETGLIPAEEYYGEIYRKAHDKITGCEEVEYIIGRIDSLEVRDAVQDFGQPTTVGKVYTFDYTAASSRGTLQVTVLDPENEPRWGDAYRQYLETVDIRSDSGARFAHCP